MEYGGSNSLKNLKGLTKETYSNKVVSVIPGQKFKKIKRKLKGK